MIELKVEKVAINLNSKMPVIILKEKEGERVFPLWTRVFEARAIVFGLEKNIEPPRPLTHDITKSLMEKLDGKVDKVVIVDLIGNTFYARILIQRSGENAEIDSRPSDAIALALRFKVPIFIDERVLNKVAAASKPIKDEEVKDFKKKLKDLKPEDFTR